MSGYMEGNYSAADLERFTEDLREENTALKAELAEARVNDRTAMSYLSDIRNTLDFSGDFPALVEYCATLNSQEHVAVVAPDFGNQAFAILNTKLPAGTKLYTTQQPVAAPAGYKLVPVEPTLTQISAARIEANRYDPKDKLLVNGIYKAMISAAPEAPQAQDKDGELIKDLYRWLGKVRLDPSDETTAALFGNRLLAAIKESK